MCLLDVLSCIFCSWFLDGYIYASTSWPYYILEFSNVEILHSICCFCVQDPGWLLRFKRLKQLCDVGNFSTARLLSTISSLSSFPLPVFLLQDLDTVVLLPYLVVDPPKKLLAQSWMLESLVKSCAGHVLWYIALFPTCSVINFISMSLSWSPLCPHLVNSCLLMNKTLKLKDEENPASQTLCGGNRLLISCLGLLSGSPGIEEA